MNIPKWTQIAALLGAVALTSTPTLAIDLAGMWAPRTHQDVMEDGGGPLPVDYVGLPLSDAGREKALLFNYSAMSQTEHQCGYYTPLYNVIGPHALKIWSLNDPIMGNKIVAWKISGYIDVDVTTIWMDGRPHPPQAAPHPYAGFTTGVWEGDVLTTYTTHIKAGFIRRNGAPNSDQATITTHIIRHGDLLTMMMRVDDPAYLSEAYVRSARWQLDPREDIPTTSAACEPISEVPRLDVPGVVPHFLPGTNPFMDEVSQIYNLPQEAVLGGPETMYPEYRKKLKDKYVRPEKCTRYCGPVTQSSSINASQNAPPR